MYTILPQRRNISFHVVSLVMVMRKYRYILTVQSYTKPWAHQRLSNVMLGVFTCFILIIFQKTLHFPIHLLFFFNFINLTVLKIALITNVTNYKFCHNLKCINVTSCQGNPHLPSVIWNYLVTLKKLLSWKFASGSCGYNTCSQICNYD